jgi:hypothetical protein
LPLPPVTEGWHPGRTFARASAAAVDLLQSWADGLIGWRLPARR